MIWILLTVLVASLLWYRILRPLTHFPRMSVKQPPRPWPFLGHQYQTVLRIKSFADFVVWVYNMYPESRYVGFMQFSIPTLMLRDPDLIKQITVKDFDHFTDHRDFIDPEVDPLWAENLFSLKGQKWREMRATLSGSFTSSKMKHMFGVINAAAQNFVQYFLDRKEDVIELDMRDTYTRYANDVIATSAFGIEVNSLEDPNNIFYTMGKSVTSFDSFFTKIQFFMFFLQPTLFRLLKLSIFAKEVTAFFRNIIHETIETREQKKIVRQDMINLLLEARKGNKDEETDVTEIGYATVEESVRLDKYKFKQLKTLSNDDITSQALIFFFAGLDTVSAALCFGSHELAVNKHVQDKLRKEILDTHKANNGKLSYDVLLKMKYLDMVFTEILRKWPPGVIADRVCTKPYTIEPVLPDEKPVHLKIGDVLWLPMQGIHNDPKYYPDPEKFDPERFSDVNKENVVPYSFIPFGSGPRNCIGSRFAILEAKTVLYHLLLHFEIVPIKRTRIPLKLDAGALTTTAEGGFWLGLMPAEKLII